MTCQCPGWYAGCDHGNPCGTEIDPEIAQETGPWCGNCNPRRQKALDGQLDQMTAMLRGGEG